MNKLFYILIFLLGISLLTSCCTLEVCSIDYLQPADVTFPSELRTVAVVNNLPENSEFKVDPQEAVTKVFNGGIMQGYGKEATEALAEGLADGNYFDQVIICDSALRQQDKVARVSIGLSSGEIKQLTADLGADMIVSLEELLIHTKQGIMYFPDSPLPENTIDATLGVLAKVYIPDRKKPFVALASKDSIYWFVSTLMPGEDKIKEASQYAGTLPVKRLIPCWITADRYYYDGGCVEMRDAGVAVRENSWEDAYQLWERIYNQKGGKTQRHAAFNLALYYELQDDLDGAEEWLEKALTLLLKGEKEENVETEVKSSDDYALIKLYQTELEKRQTERERLKLQMRRFQADF